MAKGQGGRWQDKFSAWTTEEEGRARERALCPFLNAQWLRPSARHLGRQMPQGLPKTYWLVGLRGKALLVRGKRKGNGELAGEGAKEPRSERPNSLDGPLAKTAAPTERRLSAIVTCAGGTKCFLGWPIAFLLPAEAFVCRLLSE